jgi:hypothetical protein
MNKSVEIVGLPNDGSKSIPFGTYDSSSDPVALMCIEVARLLMVGKLEATEDQVYSLLRLAKTTLEKRLGPNSIEKKIERLERFTPQPSSMQWLN